jgi:hypothetical protein
LSKAHLLILGQINVDPSFCRKFLEVRRLHDVIGLCAKAAKGKAVKRTEVGEIRTGIERWELLNGPIPRFVSSLSGERKVANTKR